MAQKMAQRGFLAEQRMRRETRREKQLWIGARVAWKAQETSQTTT
jgi:hypothetical protein